MGAGRDGGGLSRPETHTLRDGQSSPSSKSHPGPALSPPRRPAWAALDRTGFLASQSPASVCSFPAPAPAPWSRLEIRLSGSADNTSHRTCPANTLLTVHLKCKPQWHLALYLATLRWESFQGNTCRSRSWELLAPLRGVFQPKLPWCSHLPASCICSLIVF